MLQALHRVVRHDRSRPCLFQEVGGRIVVGIARDSSSPKHRAAASLPGQGDYWGYYGPASAAQWLSSMTRPASMEH